MKNRRQFLQDVSFLIFSGATILSCGKQEGGDQVIRLAAGGEVILYDTNAMALYYDGSLGPKTGVIKVQYILDNVEVTLDFWHGHGGKQHQFTLTPKHYTDLKALKKVTIETSKVDGHTHTLFIDPNDKRYRVPGAKPIPVPL